MHSFLTARFFFIALLAAVVTLTSAQKNPKPVGLSSPLKTLGEPNFSVVNINQLTTWIRADGQGNHTPSSDNGLYFPRGTGSAVYEDGFVWGGKAYLDAAHTQPAPYNQVVRVGGGTYTQGTRAGWINGTGASAVAENPSSPAVRVYRIRRDFATMPFTELQQDAAIFYEVPVEFVYSFQTDAVSAQYALDWNEWPVSQGAPYIERNGTPGYQAPPAFGPSFSPESLITGHYDEPGIAANTEVPADQVMWIAYNDLNRSATFAFAGSEPLGLELQVTVWAYKRLDLLGNVHFRRLRMINKGGVELTAGGSLGSFYIDSMYVCQWSDPDLGDYSDDLVGCDSLLSLGYVYNAGNDAVFQSYHIPTPAVGYDFLQGPIVPSPGDSAIFDLRRRSGFRNLGMTSFAYFSANSPYSDPQSYNYEFGAGRWYKMLRGYAPTGSMATVDEPYAVPPGYDPTRYPLSGDPVQHTGFLDGLGTSYSFAPGDRRLLLNTGPFSLAPGDTQEVVTAIVAGLGADQLSSIVVMKSVDVFAQAMYDNLFSLPEVPIMQPTVTFPTIADAEIHITADDWKHAFDSIRVNILDSDGSPVAVVPLLDDGAHGDGGAGDGVFGSSITLARRSTPLFAATHFVAKEGFAFDIPRFDAGIVTAGTVTLSNPTVFFDNIGHDNIISPDEYVHIGVTIHNNTPFVLPRVQVTSTEGAVQQTAVVPHMNAWGQVTMVYDPRTDGSYFALHIPSGWNQPTYATHFIIGDSLGNTWIDSVTVAVAAPTPGPATWDASPGPLGGQVSFMILDSSGNLFAFPTLGAYRSVNGGDSWTKVAGNTLAYAYSGHALPDGSLLAAGFRGIYRSTDQGSTWSFNLLDGLYTSALGPGGAMYAWTYQGILRSTNSGIDWTIISSPPLYPYWGRPGLVFDNNGRMFASGSEGFNRGVVYKSLDSGKTWSPSFTSTYTGLTIKVKSDNTLFFGTDSALFRSTNNGTSWSTMNLGVFPVRVGRIFFGTSGEVYATGSGGDSACYTSTDNGASWATTYSKYNRAHALVRDNAGRIFGSALAMVIRSTDDGANWSESSNGIHGLSVNDFAKVGGAIVMSTDRGMFRSTDDGITWEYSNTGFPPGSSSVFSTTGGVLFGSSGWKVYKSTDAGLSWTLSGSFSGPTMYEAVLTGRQGASGTVFLGMSSPIFPGTPTGPTISARILRSTNGGISWSEVSADSATYSNRIVDMASDGSGTIYAARWNGDMVVSTDNGNSWSVRAEFHFMSCLTVDGAGNVYAGKFDGVEKSTDGGVTWTMLPAAGLVGQSGQHRSWVTALEVDGAGNLFVGTQASEFSISDYGSGVFRSSDDGATFTNICEGLGLGGRPFIQALSVTATSYLLAGTYGEGVFRTTTTITNVEAEEIPISFRLDQNYPNPFNPTTRIRFSLASHEIVRLTVYNLLGQEIALLIDEPLQAGIHEREWSGRDRSGRVLPSGVYLYRIVAGPFTAAGKMMLLK